MSNMYVNLVVLENDGNVFFSYWGKPLFENVLNVLSIVFFSYWDFVFCSYWGFVFFAYWVSNRQLPPGTTGLHFSIS